MNANANKAPGLVHVSRQGVIIGQFRSADIPVKIAAGAILRADHYWMPGMQAWRLVGNSFDGQVSATQVAQPAKPTVKPTSSASQPQLRSADAKRGSMGAFAMLLCLVVVAIVLVQGYAYFTLKAPLAKVLRSDSRNQGIAASAYFRHHIPVGTIVLDVDSVGPGMRPVDILRVILQFAETQEHASYEWVILASGGRERFKMRGAYFRKLGAEYEFQNPLYTMRTMPENLYRMDGRPAFPEWEGGALAVMGEQMKNFSEFIGEWLR